MGDLIEFKSQVAQVLEEDAPDVDRFLLEEGLELLADFRSIEDPSVRQSIRQMVAKIAGALRGTSVEAGRKP